MTRKEPSSWAGDREEMDFSQGVKFEDEPAAESHGHSWADEPDVAAPRTAV